MTLLTNGYWNSQYFADNYWSDDYWPNRQAFSQFLLLSLTQGFPLKIALTQEVL